MMDAQSFPNVCDMIAHDLKKNKTKQSRAWPTGTGVEGDWLEVADATCTALALYRRRAILEVYRGGKLDRATPKAEGFIERMRYSFPSGSN